MARFLHGHTPASMRPAQHHYKALLHTGLPIMAGQMGTILMGLADTLMVGRYGTAELGASGFVNNVMGLAFIIGLGFSYGLTPVVGRLMGEGRRELVAGKLKNSLVANCQQCLLMMGLLLVLYFHLHRVGLPSELVPLTKPYFLMLWASLLPQMAFNALKQFSDAIQHTRIPMWVMLGSNALNVALNVVLIFGLCGLPEWGLLGAGVATLVSRVAQLVALWAAIRCMPCYRPYAQHFSQARLGLRQLSELHRMGWPIALQMGMEAASFCLSAVYVGWLGSLELAAHEVTITVGQFFFMLYYGMSAAVAILVSHQRGAGHIDEARRVAADGFRLNLFTGALLLLPLWLLRERIGQWFTADAQVAAMVAALVTPLTAYQLGDALQCTYANALRGLADVKPLVWTALVAYFIISLPLGYGFAFSLGWGLTGVWWAFPFGLSAAGIMYFVRFRYTLKRL